MKTIPTPRSKSIESLAPVLVTGAGGMLAYDILSVFRDELSRGQVTATDRRSMDIAEPHSVGAALDRVKPRLVINCAAYTNVDGAESERDAAQLSNAIGPKVLAQACRERKIQLVHFSTDQVFDGNYTIPRKETDPTNPLNQYAATKLAGEQAVLEAWDRHLVFRVQWLYGEKKDRFTPLRDKKVFTPFQDQIGAPTWTQEIAQTVLEAVTREANGLYHLAYDDWASWYEIFGFVKASMGYPVQLEPKLTSEVDLPARRPLFSVMSNKKLCEFFKLDSFGSWKDPLRDFLRRVSASVIN